MLQPWDPDFTLNHTAVVRLSRRCGLTGTPVALGAGWDYTTFTCDDMVIRIPKRLHTAQVLTAELERLLRLPNDLPLLVPRPRTELVAVDGIPYAAMVYPLLKGTPLCAVPSTSNVDAAIIGQQLGQFLRALHDLPVNAVPEPFSFDDWKGFVLPHLTTIEAHGEYGLSDVLRVCCNWYKRYSRTKTQFLRARGS